MLKKLLNAIRDKAPEGQFTAKYSGTCAACDKPIRPGDTVGRVHMARRRIGSSIADDPYDRICCASCHADSARNGDPSLRWKQ